MVDSASAINRDVRDPRGGRVLAEDDQCAETIVVMSVRRGRQVSEQFPDDNRMGQCGRARLVLDTTKVGSLVPSGGDGQAARKLPRQALVSKMTIRFGWTVSFTLVLAIFNSAYAADAVQASSWPLFSGSRLKGFDCLHDYPFPGDSQGRGCGRL